eukprot:TRINITY_DN2032_c0_g1_i2.p1 TRINITY_DN2032_c0_g1~~TRINITY_DN2032_c0_g1_i2.p1  ORF type:complete len:173 (-),score=39.42 TRINITY_DN2032_c0_g1_i2:6-524(-)
MCNVTNNSIPTVGFHVEEGTNAHHDVWSWDAGGTDKIRPLLVHHYRAAHGLVFVVDASDAGRAEHAREALFSVLAEEELRGVPLLLLATKCDVDGAMAPEAVGVALGLGVGGGRTSPPRAASLAEGWTMRSSGCATQWRCHQLLIAQHSLQPVRARRRWAEKPRQSDAGQVL